MSTEGEQSRDELLETIVKLRIENKKLTDFKEDNYLHNFNLNKLKGSLYESINNCKDQAEKMIKDSESEKAIIFLNCGLMSEIILEAIKSGID